MTTQLCLAGDLDLRAQSPLTTAIAEAVEDERIDRLIIDLTQLTFLDCSGIGALVLARRCAADRGCRCELRGATGVVSDLLEMFGIVGSAGSVGAVIPGARPHTGPGRPVRGDQYTP